MPLGEWVLFVLVAFGVAYWLLNAACMLRTVRRVPILERQEPPEPESWPKLSLIIPACNEAETIEAATRSRLRDGYPNLEIILVDDRSDDATGEIIDRLGADDDRVRVLHITELPNGWLGKVHAMQCGVQVATGDWLLFSDADVHIQPGTLRRTIAYCLKRGLDHLTLIPEFWSTSFLLSCAMASFLRIICLLTRVWAMEDPNSTAALGVGAFNLVRRSAFERIGGFEELRLTPGDDVGLAQMLKQSGAKCAVVNGRRHVGLQFYRSLAEAAAGTEKTALLAFGFSYVRLAAVVLVMLWLELSPVVALVVGGVLCASSAGLGGPALQGIAPGLGGPALLGLGSCGLALALLAAVPISRWLRGPILPAVAFPVGVILSAVLTVRAAILAAWRGGHMWRGVLYPNDVLRAGNRLRLP